MEPVIKDGSLVFASAIPYIFQKPKAGDIVAAKIDGKVFIKRIKSISKNTYFLIGENSRDSYDSRIFGPVAKEAIIGKVIGSFKT
jgi:SOS-response transcriptional repressor LexA